MARHGRYTIVRKLANGGMAEIFLAKQQGHEGFEKPVVLKRILSSIYADPAFRNMLIDEAHISMSLTHSNIVQVLDLGLWGGRYFLVLELIDGWDLGQVLQRAKATSLPLPQELAVFIVTEVCRALAYAHSKAGPDGTPLGIVHRDVSPNNVLISEHGEVKLADFGIAKAIHKREHTGTGVVKGKVAFMSPEQGLGKPIDARSDVFSLGSMFYLLTVGVRPFEASTDLETLLRVQRADFQAPARVKPAIEPEVARIIEHAMRFAPEERYQNAYDMLVDLERVLRTLYGGVGQTELRHYLVELARVDGQPPIGRAQPLVEGGPITGSELVEGNAVELGDESDRALSEVGSEKTDLAEIAPEMSERGELPRFSRRTVELGRFPPVEAVGRDMTPSRGSRLVMDELSLGATLDEAPPVRFGRRKSRWPTLLVVLALGGAGFALATRYGWVDRVKEMMARRLAGPGETTAGGEKPAAGEPVEAAHPARPGKKNAANRAETAAAKAVDRGSAAEPPREKERTASRASEKNAGKGEGHDVGAGADPNGTGPGTPAAGGGEATRPPPTVNADTAHPGETHPAKVPAGKSRPGAAATSRDVFRESAKRVRSISQGLDYVPPGSIELRNVPAEGSGTPPPPPSEPSPPPENN